MLVAPVISNNILSGSPSTTSPKILASTRMSPGLHYSDEQEHTSSSILGETREDMEKAKARKKKTSRRSPSPGGKSRRSGSLSSEKRRKRKGSSRRASMSGGFTSTRLSGESTHETKLSKSSSRKSLTRKNSSSKRRSRRASLSALSDLDSATLEKVTNQIETIVKQTSRRDVAKDDGEKASTTKEELVAQSPHEMTTAATEEETAPSEGLALSDIPKLPFGDDNTIESTNNTIDSSARKVNVKSLSNEDESFKWKISETAFSPLPSKSKLSIASSSPSTSKPAVHMKQRRRMSTGAGFLPEYTAPITSTTTEATSVISSTRPGMRMSMSATFQPESTATAVTETKMRRRSSMGSSMGSATLIESTTSHSLSKSSSGGAKTFMQSKVFQSRANRSSSTLETPSSPPSSPAESTMSPPWKKSTVTSSVGTIPKQRRRLSTGSTFVSPPPETTATTSTESPLYPDSTTAMRNRTPSWKKSSASPTTASFPKQQRRLSTGSASVPSLIVKPGSNPALATESPSSPDDITSTYENTMNENPWRKSLRSKQQRRLSTGSTFVSPTPETTATTAESSLYPGSATTTRTTTPSWKKSSVAPSTASFPKQQRRLSTGSASVPTLVVNPASNPTTSTESPSSPDDITSTYESTMNENPWRKSLRSKQQRRLSTGSTFVSSQPQEEPSMSSSTPAWKKKSFNTNAGSVSQSPFKSTVADSTSHPLQRRRVSVGAFHSSFVGMESSTKGFRPKRRSSVGGGATGANTFMLSKFFQTKATNSAIIIQKYARRMVAQRRSEILLKQTRKAIIVQKFVRGMLQRISFKKVLDEKLLLMNEELRERSIVPVQALARGMLQRLYLMKLSAAVYIQTQFRGWRTRMHFRIMVLTQYLEEVETHPLPEMEDVRNTLNDKKKREIIAEVKKEIEFEKSNPSLKQEDEEDILAREKVEEFSKIMAEIRSANKHLRAENTKLHNACEALAKENEKYFAKVDKYSNGMDLVEEEMPKIMETNAQWTVFNDQCLERKEQYEKAIEERTEMILHEEKLLAIYHKTIQNMIYMIRDRCLDKDLREEIADLCTAGVSTTAKDTKKEEKKDDKKKGKKKEKKDDGKSKKSDETKSRMQRRQSLSSLPVNAGEEQTTRRTQRRQSISNFVPVNAGEEQTTRRSQRRQSMSNFVSDKTAITITTSPSQKVTTNGSRSKRGGKKADLKNFLKNEKKDAGKSAAKYDMKTHNFDDYSDATSQSSTTVRTED